MRAILTVLALAAASPLAGIAPLARAGVEEEDIAGVLEQLRLTLDEGRKHLAALDYPEAIDSYTKLIDAYKTGRIPMVSPDARQIVAKAYEGRALAQANLGRNPEASADFEALVRFDPLHAVDLKGVSSKIVGLYMGVRKKIVGVVTIEGDPIGSEIQLNDQSLGLAPVNDRDVIAGDYRMRVTHAGFDPLEEDVRIEAGAKLARKYRLRPNSRSVLVATFPREVKVIVDGQERGSTFGAAGPDYDEVARELNIDLADISAPLLVEHLPPGEHEMILRRECYEDLPVRLTIEVDPENNAPLIYKPFGLEPSRGALEIVSEPPGASITLDGKAVGAAPVTIGDLCSGTHDIAMEREGLGRFTGAVEVRKRETVRVARRLRLSLAALDLRPGVKEEESLGAALSGSERYNVLAVKSGVPAEAAERARLEAEASGDRGLPERTLRDLFRTLKVELIALAVPGGPLRDQVDVLLYGSMHPLPDRRRLGAAGPEGLRKLRFALDAEVPVRSAWSGLKLIDVAGRRHPIVLAVPAGSPAALAGIGPGDLLVSVGSAPISKAADFQSVLRSAGAGDEARLVVETAGRTRDVKLKYLATPVVLPMKDPEILYNKAIADLRQAAAIATDPADRAYPWLNIAVALMHFGQWETAVRDALKSADLPDAAGISRGTVKYLTGICYEKLGLAKEAGAAYTEAASSTSATLVSHDGPLLSPSAKRRAAMLLASR